MSGELSWFELGVRDPERARAFYGALFGWQFWAGPQGRGFEISTPNIPGGVHGGDEGASPYVFFSVPDLDAALGQVRELGGEGENLDDEGSEELQRTYGRFALCRDDQGSHFGLHQPPPAD
jgi:uncharacterized protein